jgi:hypothetical protein
MKNLILLLLTLLCLSSCDTVHTKYPLEVIHIESITDENFKYKVQLKTVSGDESLYMYTDSLFLVGDTIK